jgi:DNA-directed RNA polymerase subunit alpha
MRLTLKISTGIGYDAAVARDDEATTIGGMQLDASFSPIKRVSFTVDAARVNPPIVVASSSRATAAS